MLNYSPTLSNFSVPMQLRGKRIKVPLHCGCLCVCPPPFIAALVMEMIGLLDNSLHNINWGQIYWIQPFRYIVVYSIISVKPSLVTNYSSMLQIWNTKNNLNFSVDIGYENMINTMLKDLFKLLVACVAEPTESISRVGCSCIR